MLNHRFVTALFAISIGLVFLLCDLASPCFYLAHAALFLVYLTIEFLGAYFIGLNFHFKSFNHLNKTSNKIALTFDDGPIYPQTTNVLETLKKHNVKATFFVIGKNIKGNEDVLRKIASDGHSIGSHSFSHHFWIDLWGKKKLEADIKESLLAIKECTGKETNLFRPPYGVTTPNFNYVLKKLKLVPVGWNVRSYDTSTNDVNKILDKVLTKTGKGSVILLHDRLNYMPELLDKLIPALKQNNFEFVAIG